MKAATLLLLLGISIAAAAQGSFDSAKYDKKLIRIIRRNADARKNPHRVDSILAQTRRLPFVTDCYWDGCFEKILIYPEPIRYGVVMSINGQTIERCYSMAGAKRKRRGFYMRSIGFRFKEKWDDNTLQYHHAGNCPGFVASARASCEGKK